MRLSKSDRTHKAPAKKKESKPRSPSYLNFDRKSYPWRADIDYREDPEKYLVGKGEQGVLICEPYKSELVPLWRFKTPEIARESSAQIYEMFLSYLSNDEFVGADLARKFLQMGFTRARRYANYKGGRKYDSENDYALKEKGTGEPEKAECANVFFKIWKKAEANPDYAKQKKEWRSARG